MIQIVNQPDVIESARSGKDILPSGAFAKLLVLSEATSKSISAIGGTEDRILKDGPSGDSALGVSLNEVSKPNDGKVGLIPFADDVLNLQAKVSTSDVAKDDSKVQVQAQVSSSGVVYGDSKVQAQVSSSGVVKGDSKVQAQVSSSGVVKDDSKVQAQVSSSGVVKGDSKVQAQVSSSGVVKDDLKVQAQVSSSGVVKDDSKVQAVNDSQSITVEHVVSGGEKIEAPSDLLGSEVTDLEHKILDIIGFYGGRFKGKSVVAESFQSNSSQVIGIKNIGDGMGIGHLSSLGLFKDSSNSVLPLVRVSSEPANVEPDVFEDASPVVSESVLLDPSGVSGNAVFSEAKGVSGGPVSSVVGTRLNRVAAGVTLEGYSQSTGSQKRVENRIVQPLVVSKGAVLTGSISSASGLSFDGSLLSDGGASSSSMPSSEVLSKSMTQDVVSQPVKSGPPVVKASLEDLGLLVKKMALSSVKSITVKMTPVELGVVDIKITDVGGDIQVMLRAEKTETAEILSNNEQNLRDSMKDGNNLKFSFEGGSKKQKDTHLLNLDDAGNQVDLGIEEGVKGLNIDNSKLLSITI